MDGWQFQTFLEVGISPADPSGLTTWVILLYGRSLPIPADQGNQCSLHSSVIMLLLLLWGLGQSPWAAAAAPALRWLLGDPACGLLLGLALLAGDRKSVV